LSEYIPPSADLAATTTVSPRKRRRWPAILALVAALLVGGGIGFVVGSDPLDSRSAALDQREQDADQRDEEIAQRERDFAKAKEASNAALDSRRKVLDEKGADLSRREQELLPKEREAAKNVINGDGIFLVGVDINPGTYRNSGGSRCYWQRSSGTSGEFGEILANGNESGPAVVTIQPSDVAFTSKRCGTWSLVN